MSPTSTRPAILASIGPINPHQTTTDVESTSSAQSPWLLIGSVTAALVIAVVFIILLAVIVAICSIKGKKNKKEADFRRQSVLSEDEHYYDYVHTFGAIAQTPSCNYSNLGVGLKRMKRNEAYDMANRRSMDIEASQNIAYHSALDIL